MKIREDFVDCVYGTLIDDDIQNKFRRFLINQLPFIPIKIIELSNVFAVDTGKHVYIIKNRTRIEDEHGRINTDAIYKRILNSDFIEISNDTYNLKIKEIINVPGVNVIYKLSRHEMQNLSGLIEKMENENFEYTVDTKVDKLTFKGKNKEGYYSVRQEIDEDEYRVTYFKRYERLKEWIKEYYGEIFYEYLFQI